MRKNLECFEASKVARLLVCINVPDHVVGQSDHLVSSALGHTSEAFCLGLVLERVSGEVDAGAVDIGLDKDVNTANAVKLHLLVLVLAPVAHADEVGAAGIVLLVAFG